MISPNKKKKFTPIIYSPKNKKISHQCTSYNLGHTISNPRAGPLPRAAHHSLE
jgi:hypothetical protein